MKEDKRQSLEINAEDELKKKQKILRDLHRDDEEPRNVFETFNVDDLDRLIFEDD